jgi:hypothetical protein
MSNNQEIASCAALIVGIIAVLLLVVTLLLMRAHGSEESPRLPCPVCDDYDPSCPL